MTSKDAKETGTWKPGRMRVVLLLLDSDTTSQSASGLRLARGVFYSVRGVKSRGNNHGDNVARRYPGDSITSMTIITAILVPWTAWILLLLASLHSSEGKCGEGELASSSRDNDRR